MYYVYRIHYNKKEDERWGCSHRSVGLHSSSRALAIASHRIASHRGDLSFLIGLRPIKNLNLLRPLGY